MYGPLPNRPERSVWADVTKSGLQDIKKKIAELKAEELKTRLRCNHTYKDGSSAMERHYGLDGTWSDGCSVCDT